MQLRRIAPLVALALGTAWLLPTPCAASITADEQDVRYLLRLFGDSDKVGVRSQVGSYALGLSNGATLDFNWNNERVVIPAIDSPAGSQEAVDAITTASRPIAGDAFEDFVKVRNEFTSTLRHDGVGLDYYVSSESDYLAQQIGASYNRDFIGQTLNLSVGTSYGWDAIDPLLDDDNSTAGDTRRTVHVNSVATQILSPTTMLRMGVEYNIVDGLQHNPYRNVYAAGSNQPERHPDHRERRDVFLRLNQYLPNRASLKLSYRFYNDTWGIDSHEIGGRLSQYINQGIIARYRYRYYTQSDADFYRDDYLALDGVGGNLTSDYRMAALSAHLFGVTLDFDLDTLVPDSAALQRLGLSVHYERYFNSNNYSANVFETGFSYRF